MAKQAAYRLSHREESRGYFAKRVRRFTRNLEILKQAQGCAICGARVGKLDYHHLDPATKTQNIGQMHNYSLEAFIDEVAKCTVLCASCHGRIHALGQLDLAAWSVRP